MIFGIIMIHEVHIIWYKAGIWNLKNSIFLKYTPWILTLMINKVKTWIHIRYEDECDCISHYVENSVATHKYQYTPYYSTIP